MGTLDGRVVVVTGAGRGLGRAHALLLASEGARVVVNDLGTTTDGAGTEGDPADAVVAEITAAGGTAIANRDDVADWEGARSVVAAAIEGFGDLDAVVNNAGFLRDHAIVSMAEDDFDSVVRVHLKGHFAMTHFAALHWRERHHAGERRPRALVHTASTSGLFANPGQSNYGAAKSGIATLSQIAAQELARYGVVSNCILPGARTRLTLASPGLPELMQAPDGAFDTWDPGNASPLVAYLVGERCRFTGETFSVIGGLVQRMLPWTVGDSVDSPTGWTATSLAEALDSL